MPAERLDLRRDDDARLACGERLIARLGGEAVDEGEPLRWLERLAATQAPVAALRIVEHLYGALPLRPFFTPSASDVWRRAEAGELFVDLGFFTPHPELRWHAVAPRGERRDDGLRLSGEVRIATADADATVVSCRLDGVDHLALVLHDADGAELRRDAAGCWLVLDEAPAAASGELDLAAESGRAWVDDHAAVHAFVAAHLAQRAARALRRALRLTTRDGSAFSSAQRLSMDLSACEIEIELLIAATEQSFAVESRDGLLLAAAAARCLDGIEAEIARLAAHAGVDAGWPTSAASAAFLGGPLILEGELGRRLCEAGEEVEP